MSKSSVKRKKDSRLNEAKKLKETSKEISEDDGYEETQIKAKRKKASKNASLSKKPKLDTSNTITTSSTNNVQDENRNENVNFNNNLESIAWPNSDIERLFANIETQLPQDDLMAHETRLEKINWHKVKFGSYSKVECKKVFKQIHENIRSFRILQEVLHDAREWLRLRPARPVSPFTFYCAKNRDEIEKQNPTSCEGNVIRLMKIMFNELSPEKKMKIEKAAAGEPYVTSDEEEEVEKEESSTETHDKDEPPKKAQTAFNIYMQAESQSSADDMRTQVFRLRCKVQYKNMSDKCKMHWIKLAEQDLERFQNELKVYQEKHPDYKTKAIKSILTKDEHMVKERVCGVPLKPPSSSYALFAQIMLQSKEIKEIIAKERLNHVAGLWRQLQPEEKKVYETDFNALKDKYKGEFEEYLKTLPEEEQLRLKEPKKKRKKKKRADGPSTSKKPAKVKFEEPQAPPVSVKKYFLSLTKSDNPLAAWRALDSKSKRKFEDDLTALKKTYIKNYETFLNSLSESEVKQFAALKNQTSDKNSASETDSDFDDEEEEDEDDECNDEDSGDGD